MTVLQRAAGQLRQEVRGVREAQGAGRGHKRGSAGEQLADGGELLLPFPLLSDPRGELAKRYGIWDEKEGVAAPSIGVVYRSGEIRYLYCGSDFADRPGDEEIFTALDRLDTSIEHTTGEPEIRVTAPEARKGSVRPDKRPITLEELIPYYRDVFFTTVALKKRFGGWARSGREAFKEVNKYQAMVRVYRQALEETVRLKREQG